MMYIRSIYLLCLTCSCCPKGFPVVPSSPDFFYSPLPIINLHSNISTETSQSREGKFLLLNPESEKKNLSHLLRLLLLLLLLLLPKPEKKMGLLKLGILLGAAYAIIRANNSQSLDRCDKTRQEQQYRQQ